MALPRWFMPVRGFAFLLVPRIAAATETEPDAPGRPMGDPSVDASAILSSFAEPVRPPWSTPVTYAGLSDLDNLVSPGAEDAIDAAIIQRLRIGGVDLQPGDPAWGAVATDAVARSELRLALEQWHCTAMWVVSTDALDPNAQLLSECAGWARWSVVDRVTATELWSERTELHGDASAWARRRLPEDERLALAANGRFEILLDQLGRATGHAADDPALGARIARPATTLAAALPAFTPCTATALPTAGSVFPAILTVSTTEGSRPGTWVSADGLALVVGVSPGSELLAAADGSTSPPLLLAEDADARVAAIYAPSPTGSCVTLGPLPPPAAHVWVVHEGAPASAPRVISRIQRTGNAVSIELNPTLNAADVGGLVVTRDGTLVGVVEGRRRASGATDIAITPVTALPPGIHLAPDGAAASPSATATAQATTPAPAPRQLDLDREYELDKRVRKYAGAVGLLAGGVVFILGGVSLHSFDPATGLVVVLGGGGLLIGGIAVAATPLEGGASVTASLEF